ncbi:MAG: arginine--tRNA ligase, partial [Nanoarchaeota archaeon]|nr:arginine--tRNA ligase [Nanoarchaeota archaeon]
MFEQEVKLTIEKATKLKEIQLEIPSNSEFGDFAFPCFILSKEQKKSPVEIAKELEKTIKPNKTIKQVKAIGPYLNIFINKQILSESILPQIFKEKDNFGHSKKEKQKIVIEYPGPNTNKPLHLGHVRNMCLGSSLKLLLESQGNTIIPVNINNDRGIHICKSMLAYQKYGKEDSPEKSNLKSDFFVGKYYVMFAQKVKTNPKLDDEAKLLLQKWEQGDKETITLWKQMNKWAYTGFKQTYKKFNIKFEKEYYESESYNQGKEIILEGLKNKIFEKDDETGAIFADLTNQKLDKKILLRADGTSVYITQDIYLAKKRYEDFTFDKLIYIVGNEQIYHFKVLFKIL